MKKAKAISNELRLTTKPFKTIPNNKVQFSIGTYSPQPYKSLYIEVRSHFISKHSDLKYALRRTLGNVGRHFSRSLNKELFDERFLSVYDTADKFILDGKSFTNMEFTIYPKKELSLQQINEELVKIQSSLLENVFVDDEYMSFHKNMIQNRTYARKS